MLGTEAVSEASCHRVHQEEANNPVRYRIERAHAKRLPQRGTPRPNGAEPRDAGQKSVSTGAQRVPAGRFASPPGAPPVVFKSKIS